MIIMTGATVNNNYAIKAADDMRKECTRKHSTGFLPILRTFHHVLGIALCIMFTINNNDIASNMLIAIVFYAISLSLMVNIIHTHIYKLPE